MITIIHSPLPSLRAASSGSPLFFLQGATSSYIFGVHPAGYLCHLHWGARVQADAAFAALLTAPGIPFSPEHRQPDRSKVMLDVLRYEYPTAHTGDFRTPALDARHADGTSGLRLLYAAHRVTAGKPSLPGLPATYVEANAEAQTLEVDLLDAPSGLRVTLLYTVFAGRDIVARSARITHTGSGALTLTVAASAAVDLPPGDHHMLHLPGAWARERWLERRPLHSGAQFISSRRGASSHQDHPFFALAEPSATETTGRVHGFSLVYSGNHFGGVEVDSQFKVRALLGLNPADFSWHLAPGETFQTPELILATSATGLGGLSLQYHRLYRDRLVRAPWRDRERPVLINNWEATYFDFTADKLVAIAEAAAPLGIELFVLDDGWFGRRDDDTTSLGDWHVYQTKLPAGLHDLASRINRAGLQFGLWFEPEMISPDSDLYRAHPDWCLHAPGRERTEIRNQLVLDFSRPEVVEHVYASMSAVLRSAPIRYVKWDMNRHLTEAYSAGRTAERQGETAHRHVLGVYSLMERITHEFPDILFEGCSGGGGRYDPGLLYYMPQVWCSDNSDAIARLRVQHGTSLIYPPGTLCAHVSASPNHQMHRATPFATRTHVALAGQFGFEFDLPKLDAKTLDEVKAATALAKATRHLLRTADLHRLINPPEGNLVAWMLVTPDASEALVTAVLTLAQPNWLHPRLKLRALDPTARYLVEPLTPSSPVLEHSKIPAASTATATTVETAREYQGDFLMNVGLALPFARDFDSVCWRIHRLS
jgi:alpha-galactosidase